MSLPAHLEGKRFAVTGGAGFIGSHVVDQLAKIGAQVVVIDDLSVGREENLAEARSSGRVTLVRASVCDFEAVRPALAGVEYVLHLAVQCLRVSLANPTLVHEVNASGTLQVLRAAREAGVKRFGYVSSSEVYGTAIDESAPMAETDPLLPTTPYGASKAAGELYTDSFFRCYEFPTTVIRPFNTYGPRSHANGAYGEAIPRFVARVLAGKPPVIFGDGGQTRDFTYVEDTARGIVLAGTAKQTVGQTVNIARGKEISITDVAAAVCRGCGRPDLEPVYTPARPADVRRHMAATEKASRLLDYRARIDLEEGVRRYVEWVRPRGPEVSAEEAASRNWE